MQISSFVLCLRLSMRDREKMTKSRPRGLNKDSSFCVILSWSLQPFQRESCDAPHELTPGNSSSLSLVTSTLISRHGKQSEGSASALTLSSGWALPEALTSLSCLLASWMHGVKRLLIREFVRNNFQILV